MADDHYRMVCRSARPGRTAVLMRAGWQRREDCHWCARVSEPDLGRARRHRGRSHRNWPRIRAFGPVVKAFDLDWISTYQTTIPDVPRKGDDGGWFIEVPGDDSGRTDPVGLEYTIGVVACVFAEQRGPVMRRSGTRV